MADRISDVTVYIVTIPRDMPYLGPPGAEDIAIGSDYMIRAGNGTVYPLVDRSVAVRVRTKGGAVGWGETYGIVAPRATAVIIDELFAPLITGRAPQDVEAIWQQLYDLQRVRGHFGGYVTDAAAAIDIALWDLRGRLADRPLHAMLGEQRRDRIAAYVSGLPAAMRAERVAMASHFKARGFTAFKIAAVVTDQVDEELAALRAALGPHARLMVDAHWQHDAQAAIALSHRIAPHGVDFLEAPCKPEDIAALARVRAEGALPIAAGEEWATLYEAERRFDANAIDVVQPEMAHTGVTQFTRIATAANTRDIAVIPHATIGTGIFMAASLHASAVIDDLPMHEYQHSVYDRNATLLDGMPRCDNGAFDLPKGPGLGVVPNAHFMAHAVEFGG
jgi:D-galactarolactone cycloisomerase